jgi:hypothetical protein
MRNPIPAAFLPRIAALVLWFPVALAACGCPIGSSQQQAVCDTETGSAMVAAPPELGIGTLRLQGASNCLAADGTCSVDVLFGFASGPSRGPPGLTVYVRAPPLSGAATVPAVGSVDATLFKIGADVMTLTVTGGAIEVVGSSADRFEATFNIQLQTMAGQAITLSNGHVLMSGCHLENRCAE